MNVFKKAFKGFLRDYAGFTAAYFLNAILIIIFFYLLNGNSGEFIYPILISVFIYLFFIIFKWFRYYRFYLDLQNCVRNVSYDLQPSTALQQEVSRTIASIHEKYISEINHEFVKQRNQKHFYSQWIHNMKTPVSVIDLIIQKISNNDKASTGNTEVLIEDIREENQKLFSSLEQLLNIIRLEDFAKDYMPETIDLTESVRSVINERKSQFIYNNIFPKFQKSDESVYVLSDPKWNKFMLEQIVSNAIKYSAQAGQTKNVYFVIEVSGDKTSLSISDEGAGIPEYDLPRVFEPFFTGENGRKYKNSSGIGLYISKTISEKLGHELSISSKPAQGTTVTISYLSKL